MDAGELARWTRFAAKGGIGKCTAIQDCVAERAEDLMFLKDDEVTVLMQIPEQEGLFLGYCEGVVGRFQGFDVRFHSKLKKPVMTKRSSTSTSKGSSTSPSPSMKTLPAHDAELSSLRVLVSPPPPAVEVSFPAEVPAPSPSPIHDDDPPMAPSNSNSSTSSTDDSALDTPIHTHVFKPHSNAQDTKPLIAEEVSRDADGSIPTPADTSTIPNSSLYDFDDEPSTRISVALSDGEVGIGLSLLADFAGGRGADEDWSSSSDGSGSGRSTPEADVRSPYRDSDSGGSIGSTSEGTQNQHQQNAATSPTVSSSPEEATHPFPSARPRTTSRNTSSTVSSAPRSHSQSDLGEDWEGASDIYENYRYSRFSMTSKRSSHSQASVPASEIPPPVPAPPAAGPHTHGYAASIDSQSQYSVYSRSSTTSSFALPARAPAPIARKDRPPSLKLLPAAASPLLHTSFASPRSPGATSSYSAASVASPLLRSPTLATGPGIASSLRSKLESERGPGRLPTPIEIHPPDEERRINAIVVEDDEDAPDVSGAAGAGAGAEGVDSSVSESTDDRDTLLGHGGQERGSTPPDTTSSSLQAPASPYTPDISSSSFYGTNPPLSPLSSFPLPPQQPALRPPLMSEFLTVQPAAPGSNRTSLFLPHPNAPKPPPSPAGPMYARQLTPSPLMITRPGPQQQHQSQQQQVQEQSRVGGTVRALQQAVAARYAPGGHMRRVTVYGRCEWDLVSAGGPVPIVFSLEPLPPLPVVAVPSGPGASPLGREVQVQEEEEGPPQVRVQVQDVNGVGAQTGGTPVGERRRSRSFPGIDAAASVKETLSSPATSEFVRASPALPAALLAGRKRSTSTSPSSPSERDEASPPLIRPSYPPSPLSLLQNDSGSSSTRSSVRSPMNPPMSPPMSPPLLSPSPHGSSPLMPFFPGRTPNKLRKAQSSAALTSAMISSPSMIVPPLRIPKRNASLAVHDSPTLSPGTLAMFPPRSVTLDSPNPSPTSSMPPPSTIPRTNRSTTQDSNPPSARRQDSVDTVASLSSDQRVMSPIPSGSSLGHNSSLRNKMSLPSLRSKSVQIQRTPEDAEQDSEMVHAGNVEFELIRPSIAQVASDRTSEESAVTGRDVAALDGRPFAGFLRPDSPAISMASGASSLPRSPIGEAPVIKNKPTEAETSMDAHRQRELKWMSLISQVPASQAKKTKKVKKLLMEGVPSSVRYLVWAHLTDSKARGMPGIYAQLGKRERVPMFEDIERDAQKCYPDQPQLHTAQGTLVAILQAYLTMVPDIQYETGLAYIAGRLLILAPDEDAFWIFVSLMDTYLRPWFSVNTSQMEVDGSLFSKSLENNDPQVAKKLYVDLGISQTAVCRPWFASLFAQSLPVEYLHRVWDIFLYEGVAFLFRIGLAVIHCCRHYMLSSTSEAAALDCLVRPPAACLPANPETFITLAYSFKLKDDDVRKQRIKMEAQVKRQTQIRTASAPGASISLPKA